jgi:hypothetical protein
MSGPSPNKALEVMKALEKIDAPMMRSKKFIGFMVIEISWKILLAYAIYADMSSTVLMSMIAAAGTTETAFMGAQAWHDKHVKGAKANALNGSVTKALDIVEEPELEPDPTEEEDADEAA